MSVSTGRGQNFNVASAITFPSWSTATFFAVESSTGDFDPADGAAPCVQFLVWDENTVRCEVPSNDFLHPRYRLEDADEQKLIALGWNPPSENLEDPKQLPRLCVDKAQNWADQLAAMTVAAFRDVFGVHHPAFLSSDLTGNEQTPDFRSVGRRVDRTSDTRPHRGLHAQTTSTTSRSWSLSLCFPCSALFPSETATATYPFVSVRLSCSSVRFPSPWTCSCSPPLVQDISNRTRAAEVIADLNRKWSRIKFVLIDDRLSVFLEVAGSPFVPKQLTDTCAALTSFLRTVDDEFRRTRRRRPLLREQER